METGRATKSAFVETFGESPFIKVLDFFLMYPSFDYSKTQVADEVEISRITIEKIWEKLVRDQIITKTRSIGKAQMYKLNRDNPRVKVLLKVDFELAGTYLEKQGSEAELIASKPIKKDIEELDKLVKKGIAKTHGLL